MNTEQLVNCPDVFFVPLQSFTASFVREHGCLRTACVSFIIERNKGTIKPELSVTCLMYNLSKLAQLISATPTYIWPSSRVPSAGGDLTLCCQTMTQPCPCRLAYPIP